jgi:hypothetical protein
VQNENLCDIRCPKKTWVKKYKKKLTCHNLIVRVSPGSTGEGFCLLKDPMTNMRHGVFYFEIDKDFVPPPKKIIKVKKV